MSPSHLSFKKKKIKDEKIPQLTKTNSVLTDITVKRQYNFFFHFMRGPTNRLLQPKVHGNDRRGKGTRKKKDFMDPEY